MQELHPSPGERGSAIVLSMLLMLLLFALGVALLTIGDDETVITANEEWSEGAFLAAESAIQTAVSQMSPGVNNSTQVVPWTALGKNYAFRSGARDAAGPQPPVFIGNTSGPGYSVELGTGYSGGGYVFEVYQLTGTGTGPRNSQREIEIQVELGPVAN